METKTKKFTTKYLLNIGREIADSNESLAQAIWKKRLHFVDPKCVDYSYDKTNLYFCIEYIQSYFPDFNANVLDFNFDCFNDIIDENCLDDEYLDMCRIIQKGFESRFYEILSNNSHS